MPRKNPNVDIETKTMNTQVETSTVNSVTRNEVAVDTTNIEKLRNSESGTPALGFPIHFLQLRK